MRAATLKKRPLQSFLRLPNDNFHSVDRIVKLPLNPAMDQWGGNRVLPWFFRLWILVFMGKTPLLFAAIFPG